MTAPKQEFTAGTPLPSHTIRKSSRAKRIGLRVLPGHGLEVVLPPHADPACVPGILARYRNWIDKAVARMQSRQPEAVQAEVPTMLVLKGGSEVIEIRSPHSTSHAPASEHSPVRIHSDALRRTLALPRSLSGGDLASTLDWLREWIREEARRYLGKMLASLADECGFRYTSLSIRFQRTRWGSCSMRGSINLNACLLFLPEKLVRYILLHELCHTRQLNHSEAFWKLVFAVEPDALAQDKAMRKAWRYVPGWVMAREQ